MLSQEKNNFFSTHAAERLKARDKYDYYFQELSRFFSFTVPQGSSILEVGCAAGDNLARLKPSQGVGIDFSAECVEKAKLKYPNLKFFQGDLDTLSFDQTFDYIIVNNVIEYTDDIQDSISKLKPACHSETRVVYISYNNFWRPILKCAEFMGLRLKWPERHWVSVKDIQNLFELSGFEVITKKELFLIPVNIPFISAAFNRVIAHLPFFSMLTLHNVLILRPLAVPTENYTCSIIIPCRNEKKNIEQAILRTPEMGLSTEFIFVEGGSNDGTFEECERVCKAYTHKKIKVFKQDGHGKADAVWKGFDAAEGDILMILDADLTVPPESLPKFFDAVASGRGEFINGSRLVYKMEKQAMQFLNMIANKIFSMIFSFLLGQYLKDTLCGTKVLTRKNYLNIKKGRSYFGNFDPFGDFDLLLGAAKLNLKIVEIPVHYKERVYGTTQIRRFYHGWMLLKMTLFAMRRIKFI